MNDPYSRNLFQGKNPYAAKRQVTGTLVVVLDGRYENRGLLLIKPPSRALCGGEIHELIITDEQAGAGQAVNRIAYAGFFEVRQGGVVVAGDEVYAGDVMLGCIAGYDETHMPNHLNIVLCGSRQSGLEAGLKVELPVRIG